ncbi:UvrD-helicase domain-containing protein [Halococcus sp. AFM35]|uniref:UvrD-helicase domain-containing protein n=1 Tax=Halococcus sp. AFM35 TaxID=3421653 RepID=UPI003EC0C1CB
MTSADVTKLVGSPGSGKTTKLLEFVEREAETHGTDYSDLMFLTFSRSARQEAATRIIDIYPDEDEEDVMGRVKTVHGAALISCLIDGAMEMRSEDDPNDTGQLVITEDRDNGLEYFSWFFETNFPTIRYDESENDPIAQLNEGDASGIATGNKAIAVYDYLKSKNWPLSKHHRAPFDLELDPETTMEVLESWDSYKQRNDLMQHDDYVELALERNCIPPVSVLIIDEFQDLSPLQTALYEQWRDSGHIDRIYIAGDSNQAVYGFRGAEPTYFQRTSVDEVVHHEESKRCPEAVIDAAVPIAEPIPEHDISRVTAWRDGGRVRHVDADGPHELSALVEEGLRNLPDSDSDELYLLARTNRQAGKIAYGLREGGVPYLDLKPNGPLRRWRQPLPMILSGMQAVGDGRHLPLPVARALLKNTSRSPVREAAQKRAADGGLSATQRIRGAVITQEEYREWFPDVEQARDLVPELSVDSWQRELIKGALRSGATHRPGQVRVGTIHAAKGLESPHVFVFPAYTHKQMERFENGDEAEERRLFYVAMTRASERVEVVHDYFGGDKEFPPLARL